MIFYISSIYVRCHANGWGKVVYIVLFIASLLFDIVDLVYFTASRSLGHDSALLVFQKMTRGFDLCASVPLLNWNIVVSNTMLSHVHPCWNVVAFRFKV